MGARGAIVERLDFKNRDSLPSDFWLIEVPGTIEALRSMAKSHRSRLKTQIFAVGGSNGKTTTKEWLAYLLGEYAGKDRVFKTLKSNNSILGIALSLLQIREEDFAVIEIGIDEPGWMEKHLEIVRPSGGLITMIGEEHLQSLKNIETVASEELKLLKYLKETKGFYAANLDSPWIAKESLPSNSLTYALDARAELEGKYLAPQTLSAFGLKWDNPLPGKHNAQNLLAALAALRLLAPEISLADLKKISLTAPLFSGEAHRSLWLSFAQDVRVFDDSYNANPESMEKAFESFEELSRGCHQKMILGDMLDLGEASQKSHLRILNLALVSGVNEIFLFGPLFKEAFESLQSSLPASSPKVHSFTKMEDLQKAAQDSTEAYDCFLLKGSRGMALERVLKVFND